MRKFDAPKRQAFSLIEMVCALTIAMLLLLALYLTLNTQIMHAQAGRETLAEGEVGRAILTRITNDITNQLGPVDPRGFPVYDTSAPSTDPAMPAATPMTTTDAGTAVTFNFGIRGDATSLTISSYRVQKASSELSSDLRTVSLWLVTNGADAVGLARHETKQATSAEIDMVPTELPNQNDLVFAKEVKNITFEYFDGSAWQTEWDGSAAAGEDGSSRQGPPAAIRVTLTLRRHNDPNQAAAAQDGDQGPTFQHVIALPTSNWFPPPTTTP